MNTSALPYTSVHPTILLRSALERIRLLEAEVLRLQPKPVHEEKSIRVFHAGRLIRVPLTSILYFKAESNYTRIYLTGGEQYFVSRTLKSWIDEMGDVGFLRCHRSFLVNKNVIREMSRSSGEVWLIDGSIVPTSRRFQRASVKATFEYESHPRHESTAKPDCTVHKLYLKL